MHKQSKPQEVASRIADLSPEKRKLLEQLLSDNSASSTIPALTRNAGSNDFPPSFAQERLWFVHQLDPLSYAYNINSAVRLRGHLQRHALQQALNALQQRHEVLRTAFRFIDGDLRQVISEDCSTTLRNLDICNLPTDQLETEGMRLMKEELRTPFDLTTAPLFRAVLIRISSEEHFLALTFHHIIVDGWALGILFNELGQLYHSFAKNSLSELPALAIQYADFAVWQRDWLKSEVIEKQLAYWEKQLANLSTLNLPTTRPRGSVPTYEGASRFFHIPQPLAQSLRDFSQQQGLTLFMTLLAAFNVVLSRYSGQTDIVVGSANVDRSRVELEGLAGLFVNPLVLRTQLDNNMSVRELLTSVRDLCVQAYANQDLPFEKLVDRILPKRDAAQHPLFQVMFILQNTPTWHRLALPDLETEPVNIESDIASYELTMSFVDEGEQISGECNFNKDLFDEAMVTGMVEHYLTLLGDIVANPDSAIRDLEMLSEAERKRLLVDWNDTATAEQNDLCFHELFKVQAERTPKAVAVEFRGEQLTYAELNRRANQLAHALQAAGAGPDVIVGICVERSMEMAVGLLAILKAGGAYLPLDPDYPKERLAFMLQDSQAPIVLTQQRLLESLPLNQAKIICLDSDSQSFARQNQSDPISQMTAQNLAYVIYTSGSTGAPKGVMVTHQAMVNHNCAMVREFKLRNDDRVLQFASINFDFAVEEIFPTWLSGAALVLRSEEVLSSITDFLRFVEQQHITVLDLPTAFWHEMVNGMAFAKLPLPEQVRLVIIGGEKVSPSVYATWSHLVGKRCRWLNGYGPTETTVAAIFYEPLGREINDLAEIPIGRPIANVRTYILDNELRPVPVGVPGELHIGGVGLARGYLNRKELTEEKFITDPFSDKPGTRIYKTGDLARYRADGNIEFLGRADHQVKLRGYRIEPGEIEAALREHPSVRDNVVIAMTKDGDTRLVVYIVPQPDQVAERSELRTFLRHRLPSYMVPGEFVCLDAFPITPNGKIDRKALPEPERIRPDDMPEFVAARNPVEEALVRIWAEILDLDRVSVHDNFFELGGHSLKATQVISQLRKVLQTDLPVRRLFESPTIAELARNIDTGLKDGQERPAGPISKAVYRSDIPLSFAQQRLWFLDQFDPGSPFYNVPATYLLSGLLKPTVLQQSLNEIVRHHEILRTTFTSDNGHAVQRIAPGLSLELPLIDLSGLADAEREAEVARLVQEEIKRPFDLATGPLLRATLFRLNSEKHVLVLTMHHIVTDAWSTGILYRELGALYAAFDQRQPSPLPDLRIQYADFALWQREWLQGEILQTQLDYWKQQLHDAPVLALPTDRPRPREQTYHGARQSFVLSKNLLQTLNNLGQQENATLFMVLLAAFKILLHRYSGQSDILVGSPIANRNHAEIEPLIGFFTNTLALRTRLDENPTFAELLKQVREHTLEAFAHQDLPFEKLVHELDLERDLSRNPLFQVLFTLQNAPHSALSLRGLELELLTFDIETVRFDLEVHFEEDTDGLHGSLTYNTDLYDASTIKRMAGHFESLLSAIATDPQQRVSTLPLLRPGERRQLVHEWNDTEDEYPRSQCIHELFEQQAERTPDAIALISPTGLDSDGRSSEQTDQTYKDLNRRANQIAHYLKTLGVGPDVPVGIYLPRSQEMIVAVLAVLKAGGTCLPLDSSYPRERLAYMLADAKAPVILTCDRLHGEIPVQQAKVLCLDSHDLTLSRESERNPAKSATVEDLVYVIYTSGSTGKPKGVALPHRTLANWINWLVQHSRVSGNARTLQIASLSFDASFTEIFTTLNSGGTLVLATEETRQDVHLLARCLQENCIERAILPVVILQQLAEQVDPDDGSLACMREIITTGEQLRITPAIVEFFRKLGDCFFHNHYGPSETHVATAYTLEGDPDGWPALPPIGRPIANTQIYLLDAERQPVPVGVPGELYIGGVCLAREYLNRPELTAEKFVTISFSQKTPTRLYKTGDLARYLPDGNIEFIGRMDNQVKVRGFRVEPGEIEANLNEHVGVSETVVLIREDTSGDARLVAYIVPVQQSAPSERELRQFLKERLPDYMVPAAIVMLEALPLTSNGKIDRRALPEPERVRPDDMPEFVAARNPVEKAIAGIWTDVLGLERVSVHDNFFELGGHSLKATQVVSQLRKVLQIDLPVRRLFESPTIAELAKLIDTEPQNGQNGSAGPISKSVHRGDIPLSFAQQRLWFLAQLEPDTPYYNIFLAYRLLGHVDVPALEKSLDEIIRRHEVLRTAFVMQGGVPLQVITPEPVCELTILDLQGLTESERETEAKRLATDAAQQPFDLTLGPLLRVTLICLDSAAHMLLIGMHHIVTDAWSTGVFYSELEKLYSASVQGEKAALPELPIQYADFAIWQREWLHTETCQTQLDYWLKQLREAPLLELPTDRPRPQEQSYRGRTHGFALPENLLSDINSLSRQENATPFMTLLAAFNVLLQRYSGQSDIIVGSPIANRNRAEIEHLIGFFTNIIVLRTRLDGNPTFRELLRRVREDTIDAYANQDFPVEKLIDKLDLERDLSRNPLFQVLFALHNVSSEPLSLHGLELEPLSLEGSHVRFDLEIDFSIDDGHLECGLTYNTDLFEASTIERMASHFETLLSSVVRNPSQQILAAPLLRENERRQLLFEWNATDEEYPGSTCIQALFEAQVERTPEAIAVEFGSDCLTYAELNRRANQLAHALQAVGAGPDVIVGICVERSIEMTVGLLAILKAGGAYLPLDPDYPKERLAFMLQDSQTPVLLTQERLLESLPVNQAKAICLDNDLPSLARQSQSNPANQTTAQNLAYVIYTSGPTGKPKGVMITHQGMVNHNCAMARKFELRSDDRVLQFASINFDMAVLDIFPTWLSGAAVVLRSEEVLSSTTDFLRFVERQRVTVLTVPTAFWHEMVNGMAVATLPMPEQVRLVTIGGEKVSPSVYSTWSQMVGKRCRWLNGYGPTVAAIFYEPPDQRMDGLAEIPIGRPIANVQVYILDREMRPVPVGVPGELHLGGVGVARGYLNRQELTAEKFIADPFSDKPGARIYKTGDLARYRADGNIEFLDRTDHQVKLRGYRIEPGEIEAALREHPSVRDNVVIATTNNGDTRLVAYIVPQQAQMAERSELHTFLKDCLPGYMVPNEFVCLDALPMTPNGKIDRQALPAPDTRKIEIEDDAAPATAMESLLAEIWQELLCIEQVSVYDNFFDLGGHSLLSMRVIAKLEERTGLKLNPGEFMNQTLGQIALLCEYKSDKNSPSKSEPFAKRLRQSIRNKISRTPSET